MSNVFTDQRLLSAQELSRLAAAIDGTYWFPSTSGGAVTANSGLTLNVAAITGSTVTINGSVVSTAYAGGTVTHDAADATNPRRDYIYYNSSGSVGIKKGTAAAKPVLPDLASTEIAVAEIYIAANDTTISGASEIIDKRQAHGDTTVFFDSERTAFRANRRKVALWYATSTIGSGPGFGYANNLPGTATNITGEPVVSLTSNIAYILQNAGGTTAMLSPSHSPRMLLRVQLPAVSANVTSVLTGFYADGSSLTSAGAYLRIATTGNVFFVTRQGGSETATDLGALSRTVVLGFEIETADAGVTWVCRNQAGTALATHTTNVPTAATGLNFGWYSSIATSGVTHSLASFDVEGTFA